MKPDQSPTRPLPWPYRLRDTEPVDSAPPAFSTWMEQAALDELRSQGVRRPFRTGTRLFRQDDPHGSVFLIESGLVTVSVADADGTELIVGIYGRGELMCEVSAVEKSPRSASGVGRRPGFVTEIPGSAFRAFTVRHPQAMRYLLTAVRLRLQRAEQARLTQLSVDVLGRVAQTLLSWAESFGRTGPSHITITGFSRRELAQTVGASPKSVDAALARLTSDGVVRTGRLLFVLRDLPRLRALVER